MVSHQDSHHIGVGALERLADERHLLVADASVLEGEGSRGVDPEHRRALDLVERAERVVDVAPVAVQWPGKAPEDVAQRHGLIAPHRQRVPDA